MRPFSPARPCGYAPGMGFVQVRANRVEALADRLAGRLREAPLPDPFAEEVVLVPGVATARWLGLRLAESLTVCCNIDFSLPASWSWRTVAEALGGAAGSDPLAREPAAWLIHCRLPALLDDPAFRQLRAYLHDDDDGVRRWMLARRIADLFDRYQYYRPQMIRRWSQGAETSWQPKLWRVLLDEVGAARHRVAMMDAFFAALAAGDVPGLPSRLSLFAISSLPPLLFEMMVRCADRTEIVLYQLTPTDQYWSDLLTEGGQARLAARVGDAAALHCTEGHPLLASWGRQGQHFHEQLLEADLLQEEDAWVRDWPDHLLGRLQRDLFDLSPGEERQIAAEDHSLEIHVCYSALRECQVLHDALCRRLVDDPLLRPEEILVMVPEIDRYAPFIAAVFSRDESRPFIPWNISDAVSDADAPLLQAVLQLLALPGSRFTYSEISALLDIPEFIRRFDIDSDQVGVIRRALVRAGVRWGVDGAHRAGFGLPAEEANTWRFAQRRMMAGYAMGEEIAVWHGIAPMALDRDSSQAMARFWSLFAVLDHWRKALAAPRTAGDWQLTLTTLLDHCFAAGEEGEGALQAVRDALATLVRDAGDEARLSVDLVRHWLREQLAARRSGGRYFSGGVTFCGMVPQRTLPFRHICLLGMQDSAFPRRDYLLAFDLMAGRGRRSGDPDRGQADRYLMLETLLCARDGLYISYTGRSVRDNSECQPSVLVAELLDLLRGQYGAEAVDALVRHHPLQPFSAANFTDHRGYDRYWCRVAGRIAGREETLPARPWQPVQGEAEDEVREVELAQLLAFVRHPLRYFVRHTLRLRDGVTLEEEDDEPFALDGLSAWQVKDRLLREADAPARQSARLLAEGGFPPGRSGALLFERMLDELEPIQERLHPYRELSAERRCLNLVCRIAGDREVALSGQVGGCYAGRGLLRVTPSRLAGKHLLPFWIEHLALCAAGLLVSPEESLMVAVDGVRRLPVMDAREAASHLACFVEDYLVGLRQPVPVFPAASWAFVLVRTSQAARSAALRAWRDDWRRQGDFFDSAVALLTRGVDGSPVDDAVFERWARRWYGPLLEVAQ